MSLLDKKKGLAMLPALFLLFACEEPSELGIGLNPKEDEISTHYIEIPVETSQIRIDTVVSSSTLSVDPRTGKIAGAGSVLIGKTTDPVFGTLTATAFTNIRVPSDTLPEVSSAAVVDSIFLRLNVGNNFVGDGIGSTQELKIFRLEEAIQPTSGSVATKARYRKLITSTEPLAEEIGRVSFDTADIKKSYLTIRLDNESEFATEILEKLKSDRSVFESQEAFNEFIGGLAIVPGENNSYINNYHLAGSSSIDLYVGDKKKPVSFVFIPKLGKDQLYASGDFLPTYFNLAPDYSNTIFAEAPAGNNVEFQNPDNQVYFRAGVGLIPKISFSGLEEFLNSHTTGEIIINKASLEIDSVLRSDRRLGFPNPINFFLVDNTNNRPFVGVTPTDAAAQLTGKTYINSQQDTVFRYTADLAEEVESFMLTRDTRYLQGILSPATTASLENMIADPEQIVLKIYYTVLKDLNTEDN